MYERLYGYRTGMGGRSGGYATQLSTVRMSMGYRWHRCGRNERLMTIRDDGDRRGVGQKRREQK